jgi:hypothetical protein
MLVLGLALALGPALVGEPPGATAPRDRAAVLVRRLGADAFSEREEAAGELRKLGPAAEEALRQGLTDTDPEVRSGCQRLLSQLLDAGREARLQVFLTDPAKLETPLPGWQRFSFRAGTDAVARKRYVEIYRMDGALLAGLAKDPKSLVAPLDSRITGLRATLLTPTKDADILREVTTLLFLAAEGQVPLDADAHGRFCAALNVLAERKALAKQVKDDPLLRKLLLSYLVERAAPQALNQALGSALALQLPETFDWAVQTALARDKPAQARGLAAILAGQVGGKEVSGRLAPLLDDTTAVGTFKLGTTTLHTELRDVVLAVLVQAGGQKPDEYGFPYFKAVPGLKTLPSPERLGFADAAGRTAAFKRWQEHAARQKN